MSKHMKPTTIRNNFTCGCGTCISYSVFNMILINKDWDRCQKLIFSQCWTEKDWKGKKNLYYTYKNEVFINDAQIYGKASDSTSLWNFYSPTTGPQTL